MSIYTTSHRVCCYHKIAILHWYTVNTKNNLKQDVLRRPLRVWNWWNMLTKPWCLARVDIARWINFQPNVKSGLCIVDCFPVTMGETHDEKHVLLAPRHRPYSLSGEHWTCNWWRAGGLQTAPFKVVEPEAANLANKQPLGGFLDAGHWWEKESKAHFVRKA